VHAGKKKKEKAGLELCPGVHHAVSHGSMRFVVSILTRVKSSVSCLEKKTGKIAGVCI
jgi:hypothetical protein